MGACTLMFKHSSGVGPPNFGETKEGAFDFSQGQLYKNEFHSKLLTKVLKSPFISPKLGGFDWNWSSILVNAWYHQSTSIMVSKNLPMGIWIAIPIK